MIFVDVSHLHEFLREAKPLSGIQRVTLNAVVGLERHIGPAKLRVMIFSYVLNAYCFCTVAAFLADQGRALPVLELCAFQSGDKVILPEYFWNKKVHRAASNRATFNGAKVFRIIHDVIPLAMPKLFAWSWVWKFRRFVQDALISADVVITDSEFSKTDLHKFYPRICATKPVTPLPLPHEFLSSNDVLAGGVVAAKVPAGAEELKVRKFALMVGSLEARKNAHLAVRAWQKLSTEGHKDLPMLVLVGAYTSHSWLYKRRLRMAIKNTPSILHLSSCDDAGLKWLYENCRFSLFLSAYEGWGLPVGESLWFGKPVVASNAASIPEVGAGLVDYVDVKDENAVVASLRLMCFEEGYYKACAQNIKTARLRNWDDYAVMLYDAMV